MGQPLDPQARRAEETEAPYQQKLDQAHQRNRRLRRISLALAGLALIAILAAGFSAWQSRQAQARQLTTSAELAFNECNTHRAVLLALEAQQLDQTAGAQLLHQSIPSQAQLAPGHLIREHNSQIMSVAWHPDGTYLASASFDRTAVIWETETWRRTALLNEHKDAVWSVDWSPDGTRLATASADRCIVKHVMATVRPNGSRFL